MDQLFVDVWNNDPKQVITWTGFAQTEDMTLTSSLADAQVELLLYH